MGPQLNCCTCWRKTFPCYRLCDVARTERWHHTLCHGEQQHSWADLKHRLDFVAVANIMFPLPHLLATSPPYNAFVPHYLRKIIHIFEFLCVFLFFLFFCVLFSFSLRRREGQPTFQFISCMNMKYFSQMYVDILLKLCIHLHTLRTQIVVSRYVCQCSHFFFWLCGKFLAQRQD